MLRKCLFRFAVKHLADGTILDGTLAPSSQRLLSGIATLPDGRIFKGSYHPELGFPLPGAQLEEDGDLYVGSYNNHWQRHGDGEAWLADGTHYKGQFKDDELVHGVVRIPHGVVELVFEGTLKDESFVQGKLTQPDFVYEGAFQDNKPHGKGILKFANGAVQEGTFRCGHLHGDKCTMKLESGFVYVGEFVDGKIKRGLLYTPTYTYDGEFNDQGKAHGEGSQMHLTMSPRLTFTGLWQHGALTRGVCVDEFGSPVDWQDRHDLQKEVLNNEGYDDSHIQTGQYIGAKVREVAQIHKEYTESYHHDAKKVAEEAKSERVPSKFDLGYEHSVREERDAFQEEVRKSSHVPTSTAEQISDRIKFHGGADGDAFLTDLPKNDRVNISVAKLKMMDQAGTQQLMSERMQSQYERFKREQQQDPEADAKRRGLHIDGNAPWKEFTPPTTRTSQ